METNVSSRIRAELSSLYFSQRYASFGLSAHHTEHVYLYAADGRTSDEAELPALGENGAYRCVDGAWIIDAPEDEEEAEAK